MTAKTLAPITLAEPVSARRQAPAPDRTHRPPTRSAFDETRTLRDTLAIARCAATCGLDGRMGPMPVYSSVS